ncbi:MAG: carbohydrate binding domain-containing protein [Armatimonadota bacterium]|nr:carbohydrate binding domain-containing protein [Armatimonadota bacterium]
MRSWASVGWLLGLSSILFAQEPQSRIDFETEQHGWLVLPGADGKVELTENPNDVKSGKRALRYTYTAAKGKLNAIIFLQPEPWAQAFRFWVKTDRPAMLALAIQEESGERWYAPFWVGGNAWQQVTIAYSDFTLAEDTKPQNNQLDMDDAQGIGLFDVSALFFASSEAAFLFGDQTGTHMLWLDDFEFLSKAPTRTRNPDVLDDFQRDYLQWFATVYTTIKREAGGMRVEYNLPFPYIFGVLRIVEPNALRDTRGIEVVIQVKTPTTLAMIVEEADGERWMATFEAGGEAQPEPKRLLWSAFTITDDTKGKGDGKLEPAQIKLLGLGDWDALTEGSATTNQWLVRAVRKVR